MDRTIGIDIGYGMTKTYTQDKQVIFPSAITAMIPSATFSKMAPVIIAGQKFLVGSEAERQGMRLMDTRNSSFYLSTPWFAILGQALRASLFDPRDRIIVLGMPPAQFTKEKAAQTARTVKQTSILIPDAHISYTFDFTRIEVIPQGAGIFFSYVSQDHDHLNRNVAVIDIGHYTIDMVFFSRGHYIEFCHRSIKMGVSVLLDQLAAAFQAKYDREMSHNDALILLKNGIIQSSEATYSLEEMAGIVEQYAQQVASDIEVFFEKLPVGLDVSLLAGGGANVLKGSLQPLLQKKRRILAATNPEMANAMGYWYYGNNSSE